MLESYLNWPQQIREVAENWGLCGLPGDYKYIVVFGMGGSGVVGDYLQVLAMYAGKYPVITVKSHIVPEFVDKNTLSLVVSYSGNTLETLIAFRKLVEKRAPVVAISSGGLLKEYSRAHGVLHVEVPRGLLPRASLPYMLFSALSVLNASGYGVVTKREVINSASFLEESLNYAKLEAERIAEWLYKDVVGESKLAIIATHSPLEALAIRFKNELNENSKIPVKVDVAPEWMHNDIVGYEAPGFKGFAVLELVDPDDRVGARLVEFMRTVYSELGLALYRFVLRGSSVLDKLMYGSLVAGIASVLLAEKRGLNAASTKSITRYKEVAREIFLQ